MARIYLVRHGDTDYVGRVLAGRRMGVCLNETGCAQAFDLVERFSGIAIDRIVTSPLERARDTAAPFAEARSLPLEIDEGLNEVAFGAWEGLSFSELDGLAAWRRYNSFRSGSSSPGGESAVVVQARVAAALLRIDAASPDARVMVVSHGDPIRAVIAYFAGIPIDLMLRIEVSPASVSVLEIERGGARILCLNHTEGVPA